MKRIFAKRIDHFLLARDGSIAVSAGLLAITMLAAAAGAVDYSSAISQRQELQTRLDAALLAATRADLPNKQARERMAEDYLADSFSALGGGAPPEVKLKETDGQFVAEATYEVPTAMLGIIGMDSIPLTVESRVTTVPPKPHDIALVLDVTKSMEGVKEAAMKNAAKNLIDVVMQTESFRIAVVPFARYVNVGTSNRNELGLDVPEDEAAYEDCSMEPEQICSIVMDTCTSDCSLVDSTCYEDDQPYSCKERVCNTVPEFPCEKTECVDAGTGILVEICRSRPAKVWNGWVGSREYPLNTVDDISGGDIPGILGADDWSEQSQIVRLTSSPVSVKERIDALTMNEETYMPHGILWGWRMVSNRRPFPSGTNHEDGVRVIVLMSDGINTVSQKSDTPWHNGDDRDAADQITRRICTNAKNDGVMIFSVAYDIEDVNGRKLLQDCATDPDSMFYLANDAQELSEAFDDIANSFSKLRISG